MGQWEEPLKGRSPVRERPLEEGVGLVGGASLEGIAIERRGGIFCGQVGCWRKGRAERRKEERKVLEEGWGAMLSSAWAFGNRWRELCV